MIKAKISKNVIKRNRNGKMNFAAKNQKSRIAIAFVVYAAIAGITLKLFGGMNDLTGWAIMAEAVCILLLFVYKKEGMNIVVYYYMVLAHNKDIRLFNKKSFLTDTTNKRSDKK